MAVHDTIGDFLTSLRNGQRAKKATCTIRFSRMRSALAQIFKDEGYIAGFGIREEGPGHQFIDIQFKYLDDAPAIVGIQRYSRPGCRLYSKYSAIPRVLGGLGMAVVTTSKGLMKDAEARRQKLGGEVICKIW